MVTFSMIFTDTTQF